MSSLNNTEFHGFQPPLPTRATLLPPARSRASFRSSLVLRTVADGQDRVFYTHSRGERSCLLLYAARPDVYDIWEQPDRISYDSDGKKRHHTFDFLVTLLSGKRIAVAYRPAGLARQKYRTELRRISEQLPTGFADKLMLVTDRSFRREDAYNASLLHNFRRFPDPEADGVLTKVLRTFSGQTTIRELSKLVALEGRSFAAIVRAIFYGLLAHVDKGFLEPHSTVAVEVS